MKLGTRLRHLLAFLLIVGVGAIPLAANAAASGPGMPVAMASMEAMADGMPCCPDDAPATPDCRTACPLLATCMTTFAPAAPVALAIGAHPIMTLAVPRPGDDAHRFGPMSEPPARPPRS